MSRLAITAAALALGALGTTAALAATPGSGTVSKASPEVTWTGAVTTSYPNRIPVIITEDDTFPCLPQMCDMFALEVADSDLLTIKADAPESTSTSGNAGSQVTLRIRRPDGSVSVHSTDTAGASPEKPLVVKIKNAPKGAWEIEYFNYFFGPPVEYNASAYLGTPAAAPAAEEPVTVAPPPAADQTAQEGLTVRAKAGKVSAKKANKSRKLAAKVTVSRKVKSLTATLKKGKKVVGKGRLGAFSGTKRVTLKLTKRLKAGRYSLTVAANDGSGVSAIRTVAVKVSK